MKEEVEEEGEENGEEEGEEEGDEGEESTVEVLGLCILLGAQWKNFSV